MIDSSDKRETEFDAEEANVNILTKNKPKFSENELNYIIVEYFFFPTKI
jgi:hypothetical protein